MLLPVIPAVPSWIRRHLGTEVYAGFTLLLQMCPVQVRPFICAVREGIFMVEAGQGICLISQFREKFINLYNVLIKGIFSSTVVNSAFIRKKRRKMENV